MKRLIATFVIGMILALSGCAIPPPEQKLVVMDYIGGASLSLAELESKMSERFLAAFGLWVHGFYEEGDGTFMEGIAMADHINKYPGMTEWRFDAIFERCLIECFRKFKTNQEKGIIADRMELLKEKVAKQLR